jgi:ribosomal protein L7/L12
MPTVEQHEIAALKSYIYKLEARIEFLYKHLGLEYVEPVNPDDDPEVINALRKGNVVEAIKVYRERHKAGLAEAKNAVDEMRARLGL